MRYYPSFAAHDIRYFFFLQCAVAFLVCPFLSFCPWMCPMPQGPRLLGNLRIGINRDSSGRRFASNLDSNCKVLNGPGTPLDWKRIISRGVCFPKSPVLLVRGIWIWFGPSTNHRHCTRSGHFWSRLFPTTFVLMMQVI